MVFHPGDMSCPAKLYFDEYGLYAGNHSHFKHLDVGNEITPMLDDSGLSTVKGVVSTAAL